MFGFSRLTKKQAEAKEPFSRFDSHNPYEVLEVLEKQALNSLRVVFTDSAGPVIEKLRQRLHTIGLFHGCRDALKAVVFDRIDKSFARDDFHGFRVRREDGGTYLEIEMLHRTAVAKIRIWRGRDTFFAVGDPGFDARNARSFQEIVAEKLDD